MKKVKKIMENKEKLIKNISCCFIIHLNYFLKIRGIEAAQCPKSSSFVEIK